MHTDEISFDITEFCSLRKKRNGGSTAGRARQSAASLFRSCAFLQVLLCAQLFMPLIAAADPNEVILHLVEQMEASYARIDDYVAIFHKQERVEGRLLPEETILFKFQKPFKVYMNWIGEPLNGAEALYVEGKNDNKLVAHRGGLLGIMTLVLDPRASLAMQGNRHPITEAGFGFIIEEMRLNLDRALQHGEFELIQISDATFDGRPATVVEGKFSPHERRKYYTSRMVIHIDKELLLPVANSFYDELGVLFEKYTFTDVKLNPRLTVMDFSRYNEAYRF